MNASKTGAGKEVKGNDRMSPARLAPGISAVNGSDHDPVPIIEISERDGLLHISADFTMARESSVRGEATVEFAHQGVVITRGSIQRYIPIPTDSEVHLAKVTREGGIVRVFLPTAGLGPRWRSIIMW